jgi:hypothetical protein
MSGSSTPQSIKFVSELRTALSGGHSNDKYYGQAINAVVAAIKDIAGVDDLEDFKLYLYEDKTANSLTTKQSIAAITIMEYGNNAPVFSFAMTGRLIETDTKFARVKTSSGTLVFDLVGSLDLDQL